jgi:hypothetical protein
VGRPPGDHLELAGSPLAPPQDVAIARTSAQFRAALALATATMLGLSWPLWLPSTDFPTVPFVAGLPELSPRAGWAVFVLLLGSTVAAAVGLAARFALAVSVTLLAYLVLQDQHRFQPWVYQYLMVGLLLASLPADQALRYTRWWFASTYFFSGLSKLDHSFCAEMGQTFLSVAVEPFGLAFGSWPPLWREGAALAMPAFEVAVALALVTPSFRRTGLTGAMLLHAALLWILGPWGLRHSPIVLVWNAAMMVELALLFRPGLGLETRIPGRSSWLGSAVKVVFWAGIVLPLGERWGLLDAWPAHALYASHGERTAVYLREDELAEYPEVIRRHALRTSEPGWRVLDLTGWSREVRGVPVYPQGRACNGLADALAARYGGPRLVRVVQWGRADRLSGKRTSTELLGLDAIRRQGDRYWLNAHPGAAFAPGH